MRKGSITIDFRNLYQVYLPHRGLPNIITRVIDTMSATLQTQFRFLTSVVLLVLGKRHPYDGLDVLMAEFYRRIKDRDPTAVELVHAEPVTRLSEQIIDAVVKPGESAGEIEAQLRQELTQRSAESATVLITGATGFIGTALTNELHGRKKSLSVVARSATRTRRLPDDVAVHLGNISDPELMKTALTNIQTVYHCAAAMSGDWAEFHTATVEGTRILLESLKQSQVKTLVYISSLGVIDYRRLRNGGVLDEQSPVESQPGRRGSYTRAKKEAEDMVWEFKKQNPGITVLIVRPGLVYGSENNPILKNAGVLLGSTLINFGLGGRTLGLIHVKNLANMLASLDSIAPEAASTGADPADVDVQHLAVTNNLQTTLPESAGKKAPACASLDGPIHLIDPEQPTVRQYISMYRSASENHLRVIYVPILVWRVVFKLVDFGLFLIRRKNPDFSYRFNSNSRTLKYRSLFLESHPTVNGLLTLNESVDEAIPNRKNSLEAGANRGGRERLQ